MLNAAVLPRQHPNAGMMATIGTRHWDFATNPGGKRHFWSTDEAMCLWCRSERTQAEVATWIAGGSHTEMCGRVGLIDVKMTGKQ